MYLYLTKPTALAPCTTAQLEAFGLPQELKSRLDKRLKASCLFVVDYQALVKFTPAASSPPKYVMGSMALFEIPEDEKVKNRQSIVPVCIQLISKNGTKKLFYPTDKPASWKIAKTIFQSHDGDYHEAVTHLGRTHLVQEIFMVATYRRLPPTHKIFILLKPHFEGTAFINDSADKKLISPGGVVEQLVSQSILEIQTLVAAETLKVFVYNTGCSGRYDLPCANCSAWNVKIRSTLPLL
jgi:arachidonate 15-lipoxygenase